MKVDEATLDSWSSQGSVAQSAATYKAIKDVLEDKSAPYSGRSFDIFLQGSYGNDTNIRIDSDVDIVICLTSVYYDDLDWLTEDQKRLYQEETTGGGYTLADFKTSVIEWLQKSFGSDVVVGKKAVLVKGNGNRRDADVLICAEHRLYQSYNAVYDSRYHSGIVFWTTDWKKIVNFPKQHSANLTQRHQNYHSRLKPFVRIIKNLRNRMHADGVLADGAAPSYFLEGLIWNFPWLEYRHSHRDTVDALVAWLSDLDVSDKTCANEIHYLVRPDFPTSWKTADFAVFRKAILEYWR